MAVNQLPYEPIRFTGMGSDRRQPLAVGHRMGQLLAVVQSQEGFAQLVANAVQALDSFASEVLLAGVRTRAIPQGRGS